MSATRWFRACLVSSLLALSMLLAPLLLAQVLPRSEVGTWSDEFALGGSETGSPGFNGLRGIDLHAAAVHPSTGDVYVAGRYLGGFSGLLRWTGTVWDPIDLGADTNDRVYALTFAPNGDLYLGGSFTELRGTPVNYVARWDGTSFSPLGQGLEGQVNSLLFDDATGTLYVGGRDNSAGFSGGTNADGSFVASNKIIAWDGSRWQPLGQGISGDRFAVIDAMTFDPGTGDLLLSGDMFDGMVNPDGTSVNVGNIARWDGSAWSRVGNAGFDYNVFDLTYGPDGALYAIVERDDSDGQGFWRLDGTLSTGTWTRLARFSGDDPLALTAYDSKVVVGGGFEAVLPTNAAALPLSGIAAYDPARMQWTALGAGIALPYSFGPRGIADFAEADGALWAAGGFSLAGGRLSVHVARWDPAPFDGVMVDFRLDARRAEQSQIASYYARRGRYGDADVPFVAIESGAAAGLYALAPNYTDATDSTLVARIFVPRNERVRYGYGVDLGTAFDPRRILRDEDLSNATTWAFERGERSGRSTAAATPTSLPVDLLSDAVGVPTPTGAAAYDRRLFRTTDLDPTELVRNSEVTLDFETLTQRVLVAGGLYRRGPGGTPPAGLALVSGNTFWWLDALPAEGARVRVSFDYSTVADVYVPEDLRLLRRPSGDAPWIEVDAAQDLVAQTLSVTTTDLRGQWTLGSVSDRNPMTDAPPGLVSAPNPASGAFGVPERPRLEWEAAPFALEYDLFVWPQGTPRPGSRTATTDEPGVTLTAALALGDTFSWQVVARNPNGTTDGPVWTFTTGDAADLAVTAVEAPATAVGRSEIEVAWTVTNTGNAGTRSPQWEDAVYLSRDDSLSADDALLGRVANPTALGPGDRYRQTARVTIPVRIQREGRVIDVREEDVVEGRYQVLVRADGGTRPRETETDEVNNLRAGGPIDITLPNLPDLRVTQIDDPVPFCFYPIAIASSSGSSSGGYYAPCPPEAGNSLFNMRPVLYQYTWQGVNEGDGPAAPFSDALLFQRDSVFNASDAVFLGRAFVGETEPGATYTAVTSLIDPISQAIANEVALPDSGFYFVLANLNQDAFEGAAADNNLFRAPERTIRRNVPPSDVAIQGLSVPATAQSSDSLSVAFTIRNIGPSGVPRAVIDYAIYLSEDDVLDREGDHADRLLRRWYYDNLSNGTLQPDGTARVAERVRLPDGETGTYTVFVVLDEREALNEFVNDIYYVENNRAQSPLTVSLAAYADLTPTQVNTPPSASAGTSVLVDYTVRNAGGPLPAPAFRRDVLYLSDQATWPGLAAAQRLARVDEREPLPAGASYQRDRAVTLPRDLSTGTYYLYLVADADSVRFEADEANNIRRSDEIAVTARPRPNLAATLLTQPPTMASGGEVLTVRWRVENVGPLATAATSWTDAVLLSTDAAPSGDDIRLDAVVRVGALAPGARYEAAAEVTLPADLTGTYTLLVNADDGQSVDELARENNAALPTSTTDLGLAAPADLRIASVTISGTPQAGQPVRAVVTVANEGAAIPARTSWTDAWTLSPGTEANGETVTLLTQRVQGPLAPGATYTHTVDLFLPDYAAGSHLLTTTVNNDRRVTEAGQVGNNTDARVLDIVLPPPVDLVVENVVVPAGAEPGDEVTITYDLVNRGQNPFAGLFFDAVHLSLDARFDIEDPRLAFERRALTIEPGVRRSMTMTVRLPEPGAPIHVQDAGARDNQRPRDALLGAASNTLALLRGGSPSPPPENVDADGTVPNLVPGQYRAIVWTDVRGSVRETDNDNNRTASSSTVGVDLPSLMLGEPQPVTLLPGQSRYFKLDVPAGRDLRFTLDNPTPYRDEEFEVFVAYDRVPSPGDFDQAFFAESALGAPEVLVPGSQAGTYYVLVRNPYLLAFNNDRADVSLTAEAFTFSLFSTTPEAGGNQGRVVATIRGAQLNEGTAFHLERGGTRIDGALVRLRSSMEAEVRFDLRGQALGQYDLVATQGSGSARLDEGFEVQVQSVAGIRTGVVAPTGVLINDATAYEVVLRNDGNTDQDLVVLAVALPFDQMYALETEDFVGTMLPADAVANSPDLVLPNAGIQMRIGGDEAVDLGEWGVLTVFAKNVRVGETRTARIVVPSVLGTPGEPFPVYVDALGFSQDEFAEVATVAAQELAQTIAEVDLATLPPEAQAWVDVLTAELDAGLSEADFMAYVESVGLVGDGPLRGVSLPLLYMPRDVNAPPGSGGAPQAAQLLVFPNAASQAFSQEGCRTLTCTLEAIGRFVATAYGFATLAGVFGTGCVLVGLLCAPGIVAAALVLGVIMLGVTLYRNSTGRPCTSTLLCRPFFGSDDPNDILGPDGYGDARWVPRAEPMAYRIRFENNPETANAPAKEVVITQTLDADLDLRTFRVERFGFGPYAFDLPGEGRAFYADRLDLRDSLGVFVDVSTTLDAQTREITLALRAIDPQTGDVTRDPLGGLLPPNNVPPEGDGFFAYRITPREDAPDAARIDAQASIIFDNNAPIETPAIFNTLDASAPVSRLRTGSTVVLDSTSVQLAWTGSDTGAGLSGFALYGRRVDARAATSGGNGAPPPFATTGEFAPIVTGTTDSTYVFEGAFGTAYEFFTLATDLAGNTEPMKSEPDGGVVVANEDEDDAALPRVFEVQGAYPNPFRGNATLQYATPQVGDVEIVIYDLLGRRVQVWTQSQQRPGVHRHRLQFEQLASGLYLYEVRFETETERLRETGRITHVR
ncbi:MAG: CARDB domain-containing protein [Bacteroidota bacterium]